MWNNIVTSWFNKECTNEGNPFSDLTVVIRYKNILSYVQALSYQTNLAALYEEALSYQTNLTARLYLELCTD